LLRGPGAGASGPGGPVRPGQRAQQAHDQQKPRLPL